MVQYNMKEQMPVESKQLYTISLTPSQVQYLQTLLPEASLIPQKMAQNSKLLPEKAYFSIYKNQQKKQSKLARNERNQMSSQRKFPSKDSMEIMNEHQLNRKLLQLLKSHRASKYFMKPFDPATLHVPQKFQSKYEETYLLQIERYLDSGKYLTPTQFHGDIHKMIRNSLCFNYKNPYIRNMTKIFQNYYYSVCNEIGLSFYGKHKVTPLRKMGKREILKRKKKNEKPAKKQQSIKSESQKQEMLVPFQEHSEKQQQDIQNYLIQNSIKSALKMQLSPQDFFFDFPELL